MSRQDFIPAWLIAVIIVVIIIFIAVYPTMSTIKSQHENNQLINLIDNQEMKNIPDSNTLMYREDTKIIYIIFYEGTVHAYKSYMAPYISENGNYCRFNDGKIEEIIK